MFWLVYSAGLKTLKELVKAFPNGLVWYKYFLTDSCQQDFSTRILSCFNQWQLVFELIYITILLYDRIHVASYGGPFRPFNYFSKLLTLMENNFVSLLQLSRDSNIISR